MVNQSRDAVLRFVAEDDTRAGLASISGNIRGALAPAALGFAAVGAAAGISFALINAGRESIRYAETLGRIADRSGFSVETLSQLDFVLREVGLDVGAVDEAIKTLGERAIDAVSGMTDAQESLALIGLTGEQILELDAEGRLFALADGLSRVATAEDRLAIASILLGDEAAQLAPILEDGSGRLRTALREADEFGATIDQQFVEDSRELNQNMRILDQQFKTIALTLTRELVPLLLLIGEFTSDHRSFFERAGEGLVSSTALSQFPLGYLLSQGFNFIKGQNASRREEEATRIAGFNAQADVFNDIYAPRERVRDLTVNITGGVNGTSEIEQLFTGIMRRGIESGQVYQIADC